MNIYIACALTHVPRDRFDEYTKFIHELADSLKGSHEVTYALVDSDPQLANEPDTKKSKLCYLWDKKMVENADLVIAESSFPSTGVGIELHIAESRNIPVILCYRDFGMNKSLPKKYENPDHTVHDLQIGKGYVSHMVLGLPSIIKVVEYSNELEGISKINECLSILTRG